MMPGVEEEDEEAEGEGEDVYEEVDQFGPDLRIVVDGFVDVEGTITDAEGENFTAPVSPMSPMMEQETDLLSSAAAIDAAGGVKDGGGIPLTEAALAMMEEENDKVEAAEEVRKGKEKEMS